MPDENPKPPANVAANAKHGLALRKQHNRGGTEVGVARARQLGDRKPQSPKDVDRMVSYFARHAVDKDAPKFGDDADPSAGYVAWLLWGGDAGQAWATEQKEKRNGA